MTKEETQGESDTSNSAAEDATSERAASEGATQVAVSALMDERRRFEGWISALEARRADTPEHVFKRVHADYTGRLEAVIIHLTTHTDGLRRELDALSSRLSGIHAERQRAEDERAEAELRAHVGELSGADWDITRSTSDGVLSELASRHGEVEKELQKTRELLDAAQRPVTPAASQPAEAPPAPVAASVAPPVAAPESPKVTAPAVEPHVTIPQEKAPATPKAAEAIEAPEPAPAPIPRPSPLRVIHQTPFQGMLPIEEHPIDDDEPAPLPPPRSVPRKSSFDELAFLSSVVDTPSGSIEPAPVDQPDEKTRRDTFALRADDERISNLTEKGTSALTPPSGQPPMADAVPSRSRMDAMVGRDSLVDGAKTLKCSECGAMNYPTEWYCERCGAELASL